MKSIEVKGTARTIAERSSEQARALKEIRKNGGVPCVLYGGNEVVHFTVPNEGLRNFGLYSAHLRSRLGYRRQKSKRYPERYSVPSGKRYYPARRLLSDR